MPGQKELMMGFIERWFSISSGGGNGIAEVLSIAALISAVIIILFSFRHHLGNFLLWYLEQLGKRESGDRFDA